MDADDVSMPVRFERQMDFLKKNPDVGLLGTGAQIINEKGEFLYKAVFPTSHQEIVNFFPMRNPFIHSSIIYKLAAVKEQGGYNTMLHSAQDVALWIEMSKKNRLGVLREILVKIRVHGRRTTESFQKAKRLVEALFAYYQFIRLPIVSEKSRITAMFRCAIILYKLGNRKKAIRFILNVVGRNPVGCLLNAYIWKGLAMVALYDLLPKMKYSFKKYLSIQSRQPIQHHNLFKFFI